MEYDNDRIIKPVYKIEIFYWVLLILMNPLVNGVTFFLFGLANVDRSADRQSCSFSCLSFILPVDGSFLHTSRFIFFVLGSIFCFLIIQTFLFAVYSVILKIASYPDRVILFFVSFQYDSPGEHLGDHQYVVWQ